MKPLPFLLLFAPLLYAGSEPDAFASVSTEPSILPSWITPSLDVRTRYEYRDAEGKDSSHALTVRARAGLLLGDFYGFSGFAELEATEALVDDYNAGGGADPSNDSRTTISDPENAELNRAWLQYRREELAVKVGRQRIIRNNAAFIGNVGWRQNEQTFDAASLGYEGEGFNVFYAYSNRVQRIFGYDATDAARKFDGDFHMIDGSIDLDGGSLGGYVYLVDVDNNDNVGRSNTFGTYYKCRSLHAELAWQNGNSTLPGAGDYDSFYGHVNYSKKIGGATYGGGLEYLEEDFKTPLATVHAFNGFADAFIGQRIGLNDKGGRYDGLSDLYLSYVRPEICWDLTFKGFAHYFLDDGFGDAYGWELDGVLVKKFNEQLTGLLKTAFFFEDDGTGGYEDIKQVSVQLDYKF